MPRPVTHQLGDYPQTPAGQDVINFGLGQPSPSLLPLDAVASAARDSLVGDPLMLQYGTRAGYAGFREALGRFLTEGYGHPVTAEELAVTGGTSLALSLVSQIFGDPARPVVCSDPTYFLAAGIFATQGLSIVGVPADADGLIVDELAARLASGLSPAFVYCIPAFHNPCGVTLAPERARRLVDLADRYDFLIVADEPYPLLHFGTAPPCMMTFDEGRGRVLSLGTMSKILAPGLRLGWAHASPPLLARLMDHGALRSGGCLNPVVARIVHGTLDSGFLQTHIAELRTTLATRAQAMVHALESALEVALPMPGGGYFVWLDLGEGVDTQKLLGRCRAEHRVGFTPGARCAIDRDLRSCLRLSFSFYDVPEIERGIAALAQGIRA